MYSIFIALFVIFLVIYLLCKYKQKYPGTRIEDALYEVLDKKIQDGVDLSEADEEVKKLLDKYNLNLTALLDIKQLYNLNTDVSADDYKTVLTKYV